MTQPQPSLSDLQSRCADLAADIQALSSTLTELASLLPEPPDAELEYTQPYSLATEIRVTLETMPESLRKVSEELQRLSVLTANDLQQHWVRLQASQVTRRG